MVALSLEAGKVEIVHPRATKPRIRLVLAKACAERGVGVRVDRLDQVGVGVLAELALLRRYER